MNSMPMTADGSAVLLSRRVLNEEGVECSLVSLAPGEQTSCFEMPPRRDFVLFAIEGTATVALGQVTCLLRKDEALRIPAGSENMLTAGGGGWVKLLRVAFPKREPPPEPVYIYPRDDE